MTIRVLYRGSIYDKNGASKVVKTFADNSQSFFTYCHQNVSVLDYSNNKGKTGRKPLFILKSWIISILGKNLTRKYAQSYFGSKRHIKSFYWGKSKKLIAKYNQLCLNDDAFIFHEFFTCWTYIHYCVENKQELKPYILVLHTNGDTLRMLLIKYPNIRHSDYHSILTKRINDCLRNAKSIVFVSENSANTFTHNYPSYSDKVKFVYNGIPDIKQENNPVFDGKLRIITVGTVCKRKNQIILIDCLKIIRQFQDATLTIIGDGDALNDCKMRAREQKVEKWVNFAGAVDNVEEILSNFNLFVMSSLDEGLPIAAIEALRAKLPVILTDVGGCRELIKENGYLVKPQIEDITNAILDFGEDIPKQKTMSSASFQLFKEKFTLNDMIKGYSQIIKEINT